MNRLEDDRVWCHECEHFGLNAAMETYCHKRKPWLQVWVVHRCNKLSGYEQQAEKAREKIKSWLGQKTS